MPRRPGMLQKRGTHYRVCLSVEGQRRWYGPEAQPLLRGPKRCEMPEKVWRNAVEEWMWQEHAALRERAADSLALEEPATAGLPGVVTFSQLLKQFDEVIGPTLRPTTRRSYGGTWKPVREYFIEILNDPRLDDIRARHIRGYLAWRRVNRRDGSKPVSNQTLRRDRAVLHLLFAYADRMEMLRRGNPVARVRPPKCDDREPVILSGEQFNRLLDECRSDMLKLYVLTLAETGMRAYSEALKLRWEDVDLQEGFIHVASRPDAPTKSGKGRWVPMTPRLREAMRAHFATYRFAQYGGRSTDWVFHHTARTTQHPAGSRIRDMRGGFHAGVKRAGLPVSLRQHDLRHLRVTKWLAEGKSATLVREAVGHADLATTMRYTHLAREHLRALVDEPAKGALEVEGVKS